MNNDKHLEELIKGVAKGERASFELLYEETKASVYGFALSILKKPQDAEDIMQETYLRIYRSASSYRAKSKPMAWILRIVRNLSIDNIRMREKESFPSNPEYNLPSAKDFSSSSVDMLLLESLLESLPSQDRQVVMLHSVAGLKHREISEILKIPLSTSLSKYRRSLAKLRLLMEEDKQ